MPDLKSFIDNLKFGDITLRNLKKEYIECLEKTFGKENFKKYMPFVLMLADIRIEERKRKRKQENNNRSKRDTTMCTFVCDPKLSKRHVGLEDGNSMSVLITLNESLKEMVDNAGSIGSFTAEVDRKYKETFKD
jgi:hypothetical protein